MIEVKLKVKIKVKVKMFLNHLTSNFSDWWISRTWMGGRLLLTKELKVSFQKFNISMSVHREINLLGLAGLRRNPDKFSVAQSCGNMAHEWLGPCAYFCYGCAAGNDVLFLCVLVTSEDFYFTPAGLRCLHGPRACSGWRVASDYGHWVRRVIWWNRLQLSWFSLVLRFDSKIIAVLPTTVADFTKEVQPRVAKLSLKLDGDLATLGLTSLVIVATVVLNYKMY